MEKAQDKIAIQNRLARIQKELKAPKGQKNTFGNYNYRSCEDILEAVKPLLDQLVLTVSDEMIGINDRVYVKATAKIELDNQEISVSGFAREAEIKKGMDCAQITGAASSYARKYALNGLFLIDDTKDADATNKHGKDDKKEVTTPKLKNVTNDFVNEAIDKIIAENLDSGKSTSKFKTKYEVTQDQECALLNKRKM